MNIHKTISVMEKDSKILDILRYCPYEILSRFEHQTYLAGEILFNQGEIYDVFCIILRGKADIYITVENGRRYSQAIYQKGDFIGELEIFDRKPFVCYVEALTDLHVLALDRESFLLWLEIDKTINRYFTRLMSDHFYKLSKKAGEDNLYSLNHRICNYLLSYVEKYKKDVITVKVVKSQLSEQFAVTERSINRILKSLKEKDLIDITNQSIVIKDVKGLNNELIV